MLRLWRLSRTFIEYSYLFTSLSLYIIAYIYFTCIDCNIQAVKDTTVYIFVPFLSTSCSYLSNCSHETYSVRLLHLSPLHTV